MKQPKRFGSPPTWTTEERKVFAVSSALKREKKSINSAYLDQSAKMTVDSIEATIFKAKVDKVAKALKRECEISNATWNPTGQFTINWSP